jgi:hypothetical protein
MVMPRIALVVALCFALAACGSSSSPTKTATTLAGGGAGESAPSAAVQQARVKAAGCMRAQGIDIPDPGATRAGILSLVRKLATYPQAKVTAAEQACASEIRQAFPQAASLTPAQQAARVREVRVFAACMRARGVSFPDPSSATAGGSFLAALQAVNTNSPAFKSAVTPCRAQALKVAGG